MTVAHTFSRGEVGVNAPLVTVEADTVTGLPGIQIIGLPQTAVKESKDRIKPALKNAGFTLPDRKITVSLAPADVPKMGGRYDLAIALSLLAATDQLDQGSLTTFEFLAELSLDGGLRPVAGLLPALVAAKQAGKVAIVPASNAAEASLVPETTRLAHTLSDVVAFLMGKAELKLAEAHPPCPLSRSPGLADIRGQDVAKRAMMIAAAGGHNLLFIGAPGTGKTMLASRLCNLLPAPTAHEQLEVACIQSIARGQIDPARTGQRPFRCPHHSASPVAMVGGSNPSRPGEISLAHHGVLFLDELPEFPRSVLEVLREPLESGEIHISRANSHVTYPARFQLVAAMNPCPCGYSMTEPGKCQCTLEVISRYRSRVSGPLLDRIDLQVEVTPPAAGSLSTLPMSANEDAFVLEAVQQARERMMSRCGKVNALLTNRELLDGSGIEAATLQRLDNTMQRLSISARAYFKLLKVARTLADIELKDRVSPSHLNEALGYRLVNHH